MLILPAPSMEGFHSNSQNPLTIFLTRFVWCAYVAHHVCVFIWMFGARVLFIVLSLTWNSCHLCVPLPTAKVGVELSLVREIRQMERRRFVVLSVELQMELQLVEVQQQSTCSACEWVVIWFALVCCDKHLEEINGIVGVANADAVIIVLIRGKDTSTKRIRRGFDKRRKEIWAEEREISRLRFRRFIADKVYGSDVNK